MSMVDGENILPSMKKHCEENQVNLAEPIVALDKEKCGSIGVADFFTALEVSCSLFC